MIYDTLFATDENNAVKPQMVDKYEVSPDKTLWTFTLRDGLEWHDGKPVTSEDCIASIKRWGTRDRDGPEAHGLRQGVQGGRRQDLQDGAEGAVRPGARLARQAVVERAVHDAQGGRRDRSRSSRSTARSARARSSTQKAESKPGEKHVYLKNPKYKPRAEPPSGLAGGKVVKVDRVEIDRHARPAAAGERADRRRDRPDRAAAARPHPGAEEGQGRAARRLEPARPPVRHPLQSR